MIGKIVRIALLSLVACQVHAQSNIPVGTWRTHFNYESVHLVVEANDRIYGATAFGLIFYDQDDNSINKLSKIDGLSDVEITGLDYDGTINCMAIGYSNGNIDFIKNGNILNVTTLKNSDITQSKRVNNIAFHEGLAYFSVDFGVLVIDPISGQVEEAYQNLGNSGQTIRINDISFLGSSIYLGTESGVISGTVAQNSNLQDFNNWTRYESSPVHLVDIHSIETFNGNIFAASGDAVFGLDDSNWTLQNHGESLSQIIRLRSSTDRLLVILSDAINQIDVDGNVSEVILESNTHPLDALLTSEGELWYADVNNGLSQSLDEVVTRFIPNGPVEGVISSLDRVDDAIIALPLGRTDALVPLMNQLGYSIFSEGQWNTLSPIELGGFDDITSVLLSSGDTWVASFGHGMQNTSTTLIFDESNSPLINLDQSGETRNVSVTALAPDGNGGIWVANYSENPLLRWNEDGTWDNFSFNVAASERPRDLRIGANGEVWMILEPSSGGGIMAFDSSTGEKRYINASNGNLPSTRVTDLEFDKNNQIWIGTEAGIAYFPFSQGVIGDNTIDVIRPVFGNRFLLEDKLISAIEVDEGNRKWIGTAEGVWLFEDAGDEMVHNFTRENSPLPSNNILDVLSDPITGEVFIATDKGMVSYRSDAFRSRNIHENVSIFPNPVQPGYSGVIGISGLATDATIKITNVSGKLIREINAAGGGASWDMADYNGQRAQTGVYLVFSSSSDGNETFVGKIAIIN